MQNIKVGNDIQGKYRHNFNPTHSTTESFGFLQPIFAKFIVGDSTNRFNLRSGVRLAPMPVPTFGQVQLRSYLQFVPYASLLRNYENFREGIRFSTQNRSYIPESLPTISNDTLFSILLTYSLCSVYTSSVNGYNIEYTHIQAPTGWNSNFTLFGRSPQLSLETVTIDSADFIVDGYIEGDSSGTVYTFAFQLSQYGKNLFYIFNGLGFYPQPKDYTRVNFVDIIAYYKAYFDIFDPQRSQTWTDTHAFKLLDYFVEQNNGFVTDEGDSTFNTLIDNFFSQELGYTYYVDNPDFFSAHIETTAISPSSSVPYVTPSGTSGNVSNSQNQNAIGNNLSYIDNTKLTLLKALQKVINKNTVIGQKLQSLLYVHEGVDYFENLESNDIGSCSVDCFISDVMATASTESAFLGEFAGKGIGSNLETKGDWFNFTCRYDGVFLVLQTVVPISNYPQATRPELFYTTRFALPYKKFDAIGYEVTPQSALHGESLPKYGTDSYNPTNSLGFIPRYSAFKSVFSALGGEFRLRSKKDSYLPYTLDKLLSERQLINNGNDTYSYEPGSGNIVGSPELRYIGKYDHLQNFNRIFYNNSQPLINSVFYLSPSDDNFIVHNIFEFEMINGYLPLKDSFDTDSSDNGVDIKHT